MPSRPATANAKPPSTQAPSLSTEGPSEGVSPTISNADLYDADSAALGKSKNSEIRRAAIRARWESVRDEHDRWLLPFYDLKIDRALQYLEDLRRITEEGGAILNERINGQKNIKCAGPRCGKSVEGTRPNGMPLWISTMVLKDPKQPDLQRRIYFCSELCYNQYVRNAGGSLGTDAR